MESHKLKNLGVIAAQKLDPNLLEAENPKLIKGISGPIIFHRPQNFILI
jgi:hypothetical protein